MKQTSEQIEFLIDFLLYLNEKRLINNYDFDYEKEAKKYIKESISDNWEKSLFNRCKYELRRYTELAKRMDELMHECNSEADFAGAEEAKIKRNCYNKVVNDLKLLCS